MTTFVKLNLDKIEEIRTGKHMAKKDLGLGMSAGANRNAYSSLRYQILSRGRKEVRYSTASALARALGCKIEDIAIIENEDKEEVSEPKTPLVDEEPVYIPVNGSKLIQDMHNGLTFKQLDTLCMRREGYFRNSCERNSIEKDVLNRLCTFTSKNPEDYVPVEKKEEEKAPEVKQDITVNIDTSSLETLIAGQSRLISALNTTIEKQTKMLMQQYKFINNKVKSMDETLELIATQQDNANKDIAQLKDKTKIIAQIAKEAN